MGGPTSFHETTDRPLVPKGYEQVDTLNAAKGLTVPDGGQFALIQAQGQAVRWRDDGTDPDGTTGMRLAAGSEMWFPDALSALSFIEEAASAKLNVIYYGY